MSFTFNLDPWSKVMANPLPTLAMKYEQDRAWGRIWPKRDLYSGLIWPWLSKLLSKGTFWVKYELDLAKGREYVHRQIFFYIKVCYTLKLKLRNLVQSLHIIYPKSVCGGSISWTNDVGQTDGWMDCLSTVEPAGQGPNYSQEVYHYALLSRCQIQGGTNKFLWFCASVYYRYLSYTIWKWKKMRNSRRRSQWQLRCHLIFRSLFAFTDKIEWSYS